MSRLTETADLFREVLRETQIRFITGKTSIDAVELIEAEGLVVAVFCYSDDGAPSYRISVRASESAPWRIVDGVAYPGFCAQAAAEVLIRAANLAFLDVPGVLQ